MKLYRVNGNYPDQNWNFTLNASNLGLVPAVHTHTISNIYDTSESPAVGLSVLLNNLATVGHSHDYVDSLYTGEPSEEAASIELAMTIGAGITGGITVITGNTVGINFVSPVVTNVISIFNNNPASGYTIIYATRTNMTDTSNLDAVSGVIQFRGNANA